MRLVSSLVVQHCEWLLAFVLSVQHLAYREHVGAETSDEIAKSGRVTITEAKYHYVNGVWTGFCWDSTHVQRLPLQSYSRVGNCYPYPANGLPAYSWYVEYKR